MANSYKGGNCHEQAGMPTLAIEMKKEHGYLGHFGQEKYLRAGHNVSSSTRRLRGMGNKGSDRQGATTRQGVTAVSPKRANMTTLGPQGPKQPMNKPTVETGGGFRSPILPRGRAAKKAIRRGDSNAAAVAAAHPVIAANVAAKARLKDARRSGEKGAVVRARELNRASRKTARSSVNAAKNIRKARRAERRPTVVTSGGY